MLSGDRDLATADRSLGVNCSELYQGEDEERAVYCYFAQEQYGRSCSGDGEGRVADLCSLNLLQGLWGFIR